MKNEITLYVLKLQDGCYYVGLSKNVHKRIDFHTIGNGAQWTIAHPPIGILETERTFTEDLKSAEELENKLTIKTMKDYGWRKVRGGWFCNVDESQTEKALRAHGIFVKLEEWEKNCIRRENGRLDPKEFNLNKPVKRISLLRKKVTISSVGSCDTTSRLGYYEILIEFNGEHNAYYKHHLTDTTANRCIIQGLIDGVKKLQAPYEVVLVSSCLIGLSTYPRIKGPNSDILNTLIKELEELDCTFTHKVLSSQGDKLRNHIQISQNAQPYN